MSTDVQGREHLLRRQQAIGKVFQQFSAVWPQAFAPRRLDALLGVWLDNCREIPDDMLEPAARSMLRQEMRYPPKPFEFAAHARRLLAKRTGGTIQHGTTQATPSWVWQSPRTTRIVFVQQLPDGWVWSAGMDDPSDFLAMTDDGKRAYCEQMALECPAPDTFQQAG